MNNDEWINPDGPKQAPQASQVPQAAQNINPAGQMDADEFAKVQKAKKLTTISLICHYAPTFILSVLAFMESQSIVGASLAAMAVLLASPAYIASWVLVIVALTTSKKTIMPKVVLTIYIIGVVLTILASVFLFWGAYQILDSCSKASW